MDKDHNGVRVTKLTLILMIMLSLEKMAILNLMLLLIMILMLIPRLMLMLILKMTPFQKAGAGLLVATALLSTAAGQVAVSHRLIMPVLIVSRQIRTHFCQ